MRIFKVKKNSVSARVLAEVALVLRAGGVVVFPTESSYGLAADPRSAAAVKKVFAIKKRPAGKALPLVAAGVGEVRLVASLVGVGGALATKWPAALTLVLQAKKGAKLAVVAADGTIAVRVPRSAWARAVARAAGGLATSTSANISGDAAIHDPKKIVSAFKNAKVRPDLLMDAGVLPPRPPSTIVRPRGHRIEVLRQGSVKI